MINLLQDRLEETYNTWSSLDLETQKQKINLILPLIQIQSYITTLQKISDSQSEKNLGAIARGSDILENFRTKYKELYKQDLAEMGSSDFPPETLDRIKEIQRIEATETVEERDELRDIILQYDDKYPHAHSRVMFNYGSFLQTIFDHKLTPDQKIDIQESLSQLNAEKINPLSALVEINKKFEIQKNSGVIVKDDLENHALLNQMNSYSQHIAALPAILLDEARYPTIEKAFSAPSGQYITRRTDVPDIDQAALTTFKYKLAAKGLEMYLGLESEFQLNPLRTLGLEDHESVTEGNISVKKNIGDLTARGNMQDKYSQPKTIPEITNLGLLLAKTDTEINFDPTLRENFRKFDIFQIDHHIKEFVTADNWAEIKTAIETGKSGEQVIDLPHVTNAETLKTHLTEQTKNLSDAEIYFYKLLFVENFSAKSEIEIDGVYDPKKPQESNQEIISLIGKGNLHEKLLDMIQAYEVSVGPYEISEALDKKNAALSEMRLIANKSGVSIDNPNVQLNFSLWITNENGEKEDIFLPKVVEKDGEKKVEFSQLGANILQLIAEAVAESGSVEDILRNQTEIKVSVDRKKYIGSQLVGTPYLPINEISEEGEPKPAFLTHKESAAKDVEIRVSAINDKVGVAEIRLVGNNPHFAKFNSSEITFQPRIDYIPEYLIPAINDKIGNYVSGFAVEELRSLHDAKIPVAYNGRIAGLEPVSVVGIARSNPYDRDEQDRYDAVTELRKSKIPASSIIPESASMAKSIVDFSRG